MGSDDEAWPDAGDLWFLLFSRTFAYFAGDFDPWENAKAEVRAFEKILIKRWQKA